ncbi:MAG: hypothetical protein JWO38_2672 [Gemmataceae bacterium]|nr:hypothetical protein [Gemmataceae bacterium]
MKRFLTAAFVAAVGSVGLVGCGSGSSGGPGASNKDNTPHINPTENSFTLSVPSNIPPNHIKQGETKLYTFGIDRGKNFDQDVTLRFEGLPKGLTTDPTTPVIKHGEKEVKVAFKAADDAAVGEFTIKVTGHPTTGADASKDFTIHVDKK